MPFDCRMPAHVAGTPFGISPPMAHDLLMTAREAVCNAALQWRRVLPTGLNLAFAYRIFFGILTNLNSVPPQIQLRLSSLMMEGPGRISRSSAPEAPRLFASPDRACFARIAEVWNESQRQGVLHFVEWPVAERARQIPRRV